MDSRDAGDKATQARIPPYLVTGGRTRPKQVLSLMDYIVAQTEPCEDTDPLGPNHHALIRLAGQTSYGIAVAEAAARLRQPCIVISVLAGDLVDAGAIAITSGQAPTTDVALLERILEGLKARL